MAHTVYIAVELTRDPEASGRGPGWQAAADELEVEIESTGLEVDGTVYESKVIGIGNTLAEFRESIRMRRGQS